MIHYRIHGFWRTELLVPNSFQGEEFEKAAFRWYLKVALASFVAL